MKILYVTELWSGFEDFIVNGKTEITGMPSFMKPLKYFLESEDLEIDFVILGKDEKALNISVDWLKNSKYYWVNNRSFFKINALRKIIKKGKYDFVYGQGEGGGWANMASLLTRTPFGIRYYGTFLSRHLDDSYLKFASRNLLASITYNLPKKFMLITNDGTKGDLVHKKLCIFKNSYKLQFWLNGVGKNENNSLIDHLDDSLNLSAIKSSDKILLYPARYDPWKRQHLAIEILKEIINESVQNYKLVFCGHKYDKSYLNNLRDLAKDYNIEDHIIFEDALDANSLKALMVQSSVVFSLYELSNLGNVLIEAALAGSQIVTIDDGTTSFLIEDRVSGISIKEDDHFVKNAAKRIIELERSNTSVTMRTNIKANAHNSFSTWDERAQKEKELILSAIKK